MKTTIFPFPNENRLKNVWKKDNISNGDYYVSLNKEIDVNDVKDEMIKHNSLSIEDKQTYIVIFDDKNQIILVYEYVIDNWLREDYNDIISYSLLLDHLSKSKNDSSNKIKISNGQMSFRIIFRKNEEIFHIDIKMNIKLESNKSIICDGKFYFLNQIYLNDNLIEQMIKNETIIQYFMLVLKKMESGHKLKFSMKSFSFEFDSELYEEDLIIEIVDLERLKKMKDFDLLFEKASKYKTFSIKQPIEIHISSKYYVDDLGRHIIMSERDYQIIDLEKYGTGKYFDDKINYYCPKHNFYLIEIDENFKIVKTSIYFHSKNETSVISI